ncbi:MAG: long-chain fatty acid--CoA ligase [Luteococcus japonicus]|uniref:AMP-dependent synthetase/ligase n=1 Tax=Luteococcus sp. TaxID=1969402 RepID=UPI002649F6D1|nr:long-chain fatty acid--CoA ligase [Luteococcus sp.]MDN5564362.1 long-chain fatty acid--CoA ligase [Luteococcus sp.]
MAPRPSYQLQATDHLARQFRATVERGGRRVATRVKVDGVWQEQSFAELDRQVRRVAAALVAAGVARGDRVAILGNNWPQWTCIDLACCTIGAVSVPIYPSSTTDQVRHILRDSGSRIIFVENQKLAARAREAAADEDLLDTVVGFSAAEGLLGLEDFAATATASADRDALDAQVEQRLAAASPDDLLTLVYTSGTTGAPKGVMLQHKAFTAQTVGITDGFHPAPDDHSLCFLPLSHAFERGWTFFVLAHGCATSYVPNPKTVAEMLVEVRPTMMMSVPKLYEKVISTAREKVAGDPTRERILDWALRVGGQCQHAYRKGRTPALYWRAQLPLADKLVLSSIREAMGGNKSYLGCGGAPLRREVEEFFSAVGLLMIQGYGMTEAAPLMAYNPPRAFKFGTCGPVTPGGELAIGEGGEILYRGPNLMTGYWKDPEATAAAIDENGWLHTGDAGYLDLDGYLVITDRLKDIIVTANGKNIAPQPIEAMLLADPLFEHAVVLGDNRPCLTLLVKPSLPHLAEVAEKRGISHTSPAELLENSELVDEVRQRVATLTEALPHHEQVRELRLLLEDFTLENGLLTPTLKVKRREVEKRFGEVIDDMYAKIAERRRGGSADK